MGARQKKKKRKSGMTKKKISEKLMADVFPKI